MLAGFVLLSLQSRDYAAPPAPQQSLEKAPPRVEELIRQLGDRDYFKRQKAQADLAKLGFEAFDALNEATTNDDLEIAARAKYLLRLIRVEWTKEGDSADVKRQLRDYEYQTSAERVTRMQALATIPDGRGVPALCRLVRFEQSEVLSKQAAAQILGQERYGGPPKPAVAGVIRKNLGTSHRTAAQWLLTAVRYRDDPKTALADWSKLITAEQSLLRRLPSQTEPSLVAILLRIKINWLQKERRLDEAVACMQQLIDLEKGDPRTLVDQVEWLVEQKAWKLIDEISSRFTARFASHPTLLYAIAESQAARGDTKAAEETARKALNLYPGRLDQSLKQHLDVADHLMRRGKHVWAEREYRGVIQRASAKQYLGIRAHYGLAEMLFDQGHPLPAAEALQAVVKAAGKDATNDDELARRTLGEIRARMHYFFACHAEKQGDRPGQREHLDKALEAYPAEIDTLIACYRLPGAGPEYHKKILGLIRKAADDLKETIANDSDDPNGYNQYAWLIGNTEGDYDEALRHSKTSLELSPDTGGFYDTLARVYFAKGDYEEAVRNQTKAAELDSHSGQIARQLTLFKRVRDEKKGKAKK